MTDLHEVFVDRYRDRPQHDLDAMRRTRWELTPKGVAALRRQGNSGEVPALPAPLPPDQNTR